MNTMHVAKREMNKFKTAIDYFHYPTIYVDIEGDILSCNRAFLESLGFEDEKEIKHLKFIDLMAREDRPSAFRHYEKILLGAGTAISDCYPLLKNNGEKEDVEINGTLLEDSNGTQFGILFTFNRLHDSQIRIKTIEQYIQYLKHELSPPLSAMIGFAELLLQQEDNNSENREYLKIIHENGMDIFTMLESLNELPADIKNHLNLNFEWFSVEKLFSFVTFISQMLIRRSGKDISLVTLYPQDVDLLIYGDKIRIKQILMNLVHNAIKYTETGTVELGIDENEREEYRFFVRDTGKDIPEEEQSLIFFPYYRRIQNSEFFIEEERIGLSITKHFVEDMGGNLFLFSDPERGSTFYFTLPPYAPG